MMTIKWQQHTQHKYLSPC